MGLLGTQWRLARKLHSRTVGSGRSDYGFSLVEPSAASLSG